MPEVISEPVEFPGRGRRESTDWDLIADGQAYRLDPGKDFPLDSSTASVQSAAHQAAARRGLKARTTVSDGSVIVQFYSEQE
jgi:hypothetical protein